MRTSSLRSSGNASCVPLTNHPPFPDEAAGFVGPDRAFVRRMGLQPHAPEVPYPKRVIEDQPDRFTTVAAAPVLLVADSDPQFAVAGSQVEVKDAPLPDAPAIRLDGGS